ACGCGQCSWGRWGAFDNIAGIGAGDKGASGGSGGGAGEEGGELDGGEFGGGAEFIGSHVVEEGAAELARSGAAGVDEVDGGDEELAAADICFEKDGELVVARPVVDCGDDGAEFFGGGVDVHRANVSDYVDPLQ